MAVLRKAHKSNFTVIDNQVFKSNLSLKARGLLSTMLSLPDNWHFTEAGCQYYRRTVATLSAQQSKNLKQNGF